MSENPGEKRLYTEKEVSELLRRAAELQDAATDAMPRTGLTRAQVEQIAVEVGIDARFVREAAAEAPVRNPAVASESRLFGGPMALESIRLVQGEATEAQWEAIVREVRRTIGDIGRMDRLGRAWEWTTPTSELEVTSISVRPADGQTEIEIVQRHDGAAFLYYSVGTILSLFLALSIVSGVQGPPVVEAALAAGGVVGWAASMRALFGRWTRRKGQRQQELIQRLAAVMQSAEVSSASAASVSEASMATVTTSREPVVPREYPQEQPSVTLQSRRG